MARMISAVVVGFALWSVLWVAGNALLFKGASESAARGEPIAEAGVLAGLLVLSMACSMAAGLSAGWIGRAARPVIATAVLLLAVGIAVQASMWSLMPAWYHLGFLLLIVPVTVAGGLVAKPEAPPS